MLPIAYYFLQVILCSGLLMGYYWLVLRNKRFHQYNRFYLLTVMVLSWIVPLIKIRWAHQTISEDPQMIRFLSVVADGNSEIEAKLAGSFYTFSWDMVLVAVYLLVSAILLTGLIRALYRVFRLLQTHSCKTLGDVYLIITQVKGTPFSFFRYIFWNDEIDIRSESGKQILAHELTHVEQKHSFDKIMIQLMLIAGWCNPFFWLIKKEMEMIHEFIADKKAVGNGDAASLAQMLLKASYPQQSFVLTHPFFFSPIKRRLQMLTNTQNPRFSYLRRLIVLPLLALMVVLVAFRKKEDRTDATISVSSVVENVVNDVVSPKNDTKNTSGTTVLNEAILDKRYTVPGDQGTLQQIKNDAVQTKISEASPQGGKNYLRKPVQTSLILDRPLIDTVIKQENKEAVTIEWRDALYDNQLADVLLILDGKQISRDEMKKLDPGAIASITVLKGQLAANSYGDAGKKGVLVIHSKKEVVYDSYKYKEGNTNNLQLRGHVNRKYPDSVILIRNPTGADPIIIIDGVRGKLSDIVPDDINSITVLKGKSGIDQYGADGINGVIEIETKDHRKKEAEADRLFTQTQILPEFPGGVKAWEKYLQRNLNSKIVEKSDGPPGKYTVQVSFIVEKDGYIHDVKALSDPGFGSAEEAIRVISKGPRWKPAIQNGKVVTAIHKQNITFIVPGPVKKL